MEPRLSFHVKPWTHFRSNDEKWHHFGASMEVPRFFLVRFPLCGVFSHTRCRILIVLQKICLHWTQGPLTTSCNFLSPSPEALFFALYYGCLTANSDHRPDFKLLYTQPLLTNLVSRQLASKLYQSSTLVGRQLSLFNGISRRESYQTLAGYFTLVQSRGPGLQWQMPSYRNFSLSLNNRTQKIPMILGSSLCFGFWKYCRYTWSGATKLFLGEMV